MAGSLHGAARRGNVKELRLTIRGWTSVEFLFGILHFCLSRIMIEEFAEDVNGYDFQKMTALHHAAKRGYSEAVQFLIQARAKLEIVNSIGQTPLHVAAQAGRLEAARILLDHGADPNTASDHDIRPIHRVSKAGYHEIASVLIKAGADLDVPDSFLRECAIHHAASEGHVEVMRLLMCHATRILDDANTRGETALHMAAANNHVEACKALLMMGVSPKWKSAFLNLKDNKQQDTALHKACIQGHIAVSRLLLDSKAIPNVQNMLGRTPLHYAAVGEDPMLVSFMLRAGADHLLVDYDGKRAVQCCTNERIRLAFDTAIGIPAQFQTQMIFTRQKLIHDKRRDLKTEEMRKVMGADDKSVSKQAEIALARESRRVQKRRDADEEDLYMRLRRNWAHKTILKYWKAYLVLKEEKASILKFSFINIGTDARSTEKGSRTDQEKAGGRRTPNQSRNNKWFRLSLINFCRKSE